MNKLIEMAVNCLLPIRTYRRIVGFQKTISELEESKKYLEISLARKLVGDAVNESQLKQSLDDALKREDSLKSQNESLLTEVSKLQEDVRLKHTDVIRKLEDAEGRCKALNSTVDYLKRELETARDDAIQFRKQASSLKEWIRHVHRLDSIPVSHSIKDILQKAQV